MIVHVIRMLFFALPNFQLRKCSNADQARKLVALSKTWAFLRPDKESVWTLLAITQRLFSCFESTEKKTITQDLIAASLLSAFAVCFPSPTSKASIRYFWI